MLVAGRRGGMAERVARGQVKSTSWPSELLGAKYCSGREGRVVASSSSVGASGVDENARAMEAPRRESPMSRD